MKTLLLASTLLLAPISAYAGGKDPKPPTTPATPSTVNTLGQHQGQGQIQGQGQGQSQTSNNTNVNRNNASSRAAARAAARATARQSQANSQTTIFRSHRNTIIAPTVTPSNNVCGDSSISVGLLDLAAFGASYGKRWCEILEKASVFFNMGQHQLGYAMLARDPDFYAVFQSQGLILNPRSGNVVSSKY